MARQDNADVFESTELIDFPSKGDLAHPTGRTWIDRDDSSTHPCLECGGTMEWDNVDISEDGEVVVWLCTDCGNTSLRENNGMKGSEEDHEKRQEPAADQEVSWKRFGQVGGLNNDRCTECGERKSDEDKELSETCLTTLVAFKFDEMPADSSEIRPQATTIGVVSDPNDRMRYACDELMPHLGMPIEKLADFQRIRDEEMAGMESDRHKLAWEREEMDEYYRNYLERSQDANKAVRELFNRVWNGEEITLIGYEFPPKRSHRHVLLDYLEERLVEEAENVLNKYSPTCEACDTR